MRVTRTATRAIEARLTERLGDAGRKVHTGRSRNDQILVATRLWLKTRLPSCALRVCRERRASASDRAAGEVAAAAGLHAPAARGRVVDGACGSPAFAEGFIDNAQRARDTLAWIDANPLGTAAGYGVNLQTRSRSHDAGARLRAHAGVAGLCAAVARQVRDRRARCARNSPCSTCGGLAWDLSLFTTAEFGFVALPAAIHDRLVDHAGTSAIPTSSN